MSNKTAITFISTFLFLTGIQSVQASMCNTTSPNFVVEGDLYYEIREVEPLSRKQTRAIKQIFSPLTSQNLTGHGKFTFCEIKEGNTSETTNKETIKANIDLDSSGLVTISFNIFNLDKKISLDESSLFFGPASPFVITNYSSSHITMASKLRKRSGRSGAAIIHEDIIDISKSKGLLTFVTTRYFNGNFGFQKTRTLRYR